MHTRSQINSAGFQPAFVPRDGELNPQRLKDSTLGANQHSQPIPGRVRHNEEVFGLLWYLGLGDAAVLAVLDDRERCYSLARAINLEVCGGGGMLGDGEHVERAVGAQGGDALHRGPHHRGWMSCGFRELECLPGQT